MPEVEFRLACPEDDAELQRLNELPMPGDWLELSYQRRPSFFVGLSSPQDQVLIGRLAQGPAVAMAVRSPRRVYQNGKEVEVGYLSGLRVDPRYQGGTMLWRGYQLLSRVQEQFPLSEHLATVIEGNQLARQLLVERRRPSWPRFLPYRRLFTLALPTQEQPGSRTFPAEEGAEVQKTLERFAPQRQFFPCQVEPALPGERRFWLTHPEGVAALRDLSASRQTVVHAYRRPLASMRWLYNLWARPRLPAPGQPLKGAYAGYFAARSRAAFDALLQGLLHQARQLGKDWLYLGMVEDDPYLDQARKFPHRLYSSQIYRIWWAQQKEIDLDERPGYLELASL